jgi:exosome complex exonuclease DIS3/RRP44
MIFYDEYIENKTDIENKIIGQIDIIENENYIKIDEKYIKIINNRSIYSDIVIINEKNTVINVIERNSCEIPGILYLDSKIRYGFYKNRMLYLFKPTDKRYCNFYVPYDGKFKNKIFVIINFKEWKITDKLPIGTLLEVIGNVGIKEAEYEHLRYYYGIKNNIWKVDNERRINDLKKIESIENVNIDYEVFSIDPLGSKDIDDAFHYNKISNDIFEIGIHIANPYIFFKNDLHIIFNRVSTVYLPDRKYNMLPNIYADDLLSLIENKNRYSLSLILKINKITKKVEEYELGEKIVRNIKNYDYDEFDLKLKKDKSMKLFVEDSKIYFEINNLDSHKLVENWMIFTNKFIANYLINKGNQNVIIRKLDQRIISEDTIEDTIDDKKLIEFMNYKKENSAIYKIYDKDDINNQFHYKLGNDFYTHYTSPIRRVVDIIIHGLIINDNELMDKTILENYLIKINEFNKKNRRFDRSIRRLEFLYNNSEKKSIITYGYVVKIDENKLKVYLPEYNLEEKIIIIPYIFNNITEKNIIKDKNNIIININYMVENDKFEYNIYDRLEIKIWIFITAENIFDKVKLEIIR